MNIAIVIQISIRFQIPVLPRKSMSKLQQRSQRVFDLFALWNYCLPETTLLRRIELF